jgi:predicted nucleic acid-binding protein
VISRLLPTQDCVIDASVIVKWILWDETAVPQALALLSTAVSEGRTLLVPTLWQYEVANTLAVAVRKGRLHADDALAFLEAVAEQPLLALPVPPAVPHTMALRLGISAYDAAYVALADDLGLSLWTADLRLYDSVHPAMPFVRRIGDFAAQP